MRHQYLLIILTLQHCQTVPHFPKSDDIAGIKGDLIIVGLASFNTTATKISFPTKTTELLHNLSTLLGR